MSTCRTTHQKSRIVFEENKRKMCFENPQKRTVTEVRVDGCEITDGLRCDFLLIEESQTEHFVELKGSDIAHAYRQILATIKQLSTSSARNPVKKYAWVISSRFPQDDSILRKAKLAFKQHHVSITVKNSQHSHTLP